MKLISQPRTFKEELCLFLFECFIIVLCLALGYGMVQFGWFVMELRDKAMAVWALFTILVAVAPYAVFKLLR